MFADRIFEEAVAELMGKNKHLQNWSVIAHHQHLMFLKKYSLSWYFEFLYCLLMKRVTFFFGFFWDKLIKKKMLYTLTKKMEQEKIVLKLALLLLVVVVVLYLVNTWVFVVNRRGNYTRIKTCKMVLLFVDSVKIEVYYF